LGSVFKKNKGRRPNRQPLVKETKPKLTKLRVPRWREKERELVGWEK